MCGIAGAFGPGAKTAHARLDAALDAISHRGPDGKGSFLSSDGTCLLGHRRLSILDLSPAAAQPMLRGARALAYNGEIYNHAALRKGLNCAFQTHSDTETLLALLEQGGEAVLSSLDGMFAGACYNEKVRELALFRDTMGIKQFYYAQDAEGTFFFASEIKALFALAPQLPRKACQDTLQLYLSYENYPQGMSLFEGVSLLKPGEVLTLRTGENGKVCKRTAFISVQQSGVERGARSRADIVRQLRRELETAVSEHLLSDVPVGVYLSGGIDSSLVAALAARRSKNLLAFTGYFQGQGGYYDERPLARITAANCGLELHEIAITPQDFSENFDRIIWALDEPRMAMGSFSQYMVAKSAGSLRKVILAGHGGDELFAGYPLFKAMRFAGLPWFSADWFKALAGMKAREYAWAADQALESLRGGMRFAPRIFDAGRHPQFQAPITTDRLQALRAYYENVYLPGLLTVEDKISMAWSLETRVPLWSRRLRDFASALSPDELLRGGELKSLLKEAASEYLPVEILRAPKRGFPTPLRLWFRDELYGYVRQRLLGGGFAASVLPAKAIERLLWEHKNLPLPFSFDEKRAHKIWILLSLQSWAEQYKVRL